jgi:hypothetical protein
VESVVNELKWKTSIRILLLGLVLMVSLGASADALDGYERFVKPDGSFVFSGQPVRDGLVHLGEWFVPEGPAAGFHHVYTQAAAIEAFRATGVFPDGAVLVKELRKHQTANYTTGAGVASATAPTQWFMMVKDAKGRFPESPLWRKGWGWALFKADAPTKNVATSFEADCQGCHIPARETDWVYTIGYPRLAR